MKLMKFFTIRNLHIVSIIGVLTIYLIAAVSYIENDTAYINFMNHQYEIGRCMYKEQIGISCPTCGMTRSFISITHLKVHDFFKYNTLGMFVFLASVLLLVFNIMSLRKHRYAAKVGDCLSVYGIVVAIGLAIVWFIRVVILKQIY